MINRTFPLFGEVQRRLDALNTVMQENLAGVRVVKAFVRADHEIERFREANDGLMDQTLRAMPHHGRHDAVHDARAQLRRRRRALVRRRAGQGRRHAGRPAHRLHQLPARRR